MNAVVAFQPPAGLAQISHTGRMDVAEVLGHLHVIQKVMKEVMKENVHYGKIPGTPKPTLLKPGAELLCMVFHIAPTYRVEDLATGDCTRYRVTCHGSHQGTGVVLGEGMGEAASIEEKYKWRKAICDEEWNETPPDRRREKFGRGQHGIYRQKQIRTEAADAANTVLKMANKRAQVAMVLNVLAASDMFSQDLEDIESGLRENMVGDGAAQDQAGSQQAQPQSGPEPWPEDKLRIRFPKYVEWLAAGKTHDEIIEFALTKGTLTDAQKQAIRALKPETPAAPANTDQQGDKSLAAEDAPTVSFAEIADRIVKATTKDQLDEIQALIPAIQNEEHRTELDGKVEARRAELSKEA